MPGLFGVLSKSPRITQEQLHVMARRMADVMRSKPWLTTDFWGNEMFCGGRVHLGVLNPHTQPMCNQDSTAIAWFDGEVYRGENKPAVTPTMDEIIAITSVSGQLAELDGVFATAYIDLNEGRLTLANDKLGFRPLYYLDTPNWFAYAAEVKALLAVCDSRPALDEISLRQFFGFGYMLGERTWWENINLLPPASLWHISLHERKMCTYWTYDEILREPRSDEEVLPEFGKLWSRAVRQRSRPGTMPLLLSGGMDSRLMLAELNRQGAEVECITFGEQNSSDIRLAEICARIERSRHVLLEFDADNYWNRREEAIWQTDGLINAQDLHVSIAFDHLHRGNLYSPMNLAGDLVFGGSYLRHDVSHNWRTSPSVLLETKFIENPFFSREATVEAAMADVHKYIKGPSPDCFYMTQRVRRCTIYGPISCAAYCESVYPSTSSPLLSLILGSLDDEQRASSKFYNRFLILNYPAYYSNVPWQQSGRGLDESLGIRLIRGTSNRLERRSSFLARRRFGTSRYQGSFVNYAKLVAASQVRETLLEKNLVIDQVFGGAVRQALLDTSDPRFSTTTLLGLVTLETYFRQVEGIAPEARGNEVLLE